MADQPRRRKKRPHHSTGPHLIPGRTPEIRRRRRRDALVIITFFLLSMLVVYVMLWDPMRMPNAPG
jgi:hypothetical protein